MIRNKEGQDDNDDYAEDKNNNCDEYANDGINDDDIQETNKKLRNPFFWIILISPENFFFHSIYQIDPCNP